VFSVLFFLPYMNITFLIILFFRVITLNDCAAIYLILNIYIYIYYIYEQYLPPYLNSNANLCNRIDVESSRCTSSTNFDMFVSNDTDTSDQTDCSFIQSVRSGTYDSDGQLYIDSVYGSSRKVTDTQKALLGVSLAICALLAFYSCYLHHAITNLLIKSLSHSDLLPPSRFHRRRSNGNRRRGRRSRKLPVNDDEDEDEDEDEEENLKVKGVDDENQLT
jgi:hypothetical protein